MALWYDAADAATITLSGSYVTAWADKSGGARTANSPGPNLTTNAPTIALSNQNSLNGIRFSASPGTCLNIPSFSSGPITVFLMLKYIAVTDAGIAFYISQSGQSLVWRFTTDSGIQSLAVDYGAGSRRYYMNPPVANTNAHMMVLSMPVSADGTLWIDGTQGTKTSPAPQVGSGSFIQGCLGAYNQSPTNASYDGYVYEVIWYTGQLSTSNRQNIEGYLAWKWGIQSSLPNTHPYYSSAPVLTPSLVNYATETIDSNYNYQLSATSNIRLTRPTEYRWLTSNVSATSLTLSSSNLSTVYRITNTGFNSLTVPSLTSGDSGAFWVLSNTTSSNLSVTLSGTVGLSSPYVFGANNYVNLYWDGASNYITSAGDPRAWASNGGVFLSNSNVGIGTTVPRSGFQSNSATSGIRALDVSGQVFGRLPIFIVSNTTLDVDTNYNAYQNTYFYITNSGFSNLTVPSTLSTSNGGTFFQLKNSTTSSLSITITGSVGITSPVSISPSNALTFVVSPSSSNTMLLL